MYFSDSLNTTSQQTTMLSIHVGRQYRGTLSLANHSLIEPSSITQSEREFPLCVGPRIQTLVRPDTILELDALPIRLHHCQLDSHCSSAARHSGRPGHSYVSFRGVWNEDRSVRRLHDPLCSFGSANSAV